MKFTFGNQTDCKLSLEKSNSKAKRLLMCFAMACFTICGFSQAIAIKRETAFGTAGLDFGNYRLMAHSSGEIVVLYNDLANSESDSVASNITRWNHGRFTRQLTRVSDRIVDISGSHMNFKTFLETPGKGIVTIGSSALSQALPGAHDYNIKIIEWTDFGGLQFTAYYGGNGDDFAVGIQNTSDGSYLIVANSLSTDQDIQNKTGKSQVWLAKIDNKGKKLWGKLLTSNYEHEAADFIRTPDGNYAICGKVRADVSLGANAGMGEAFVMKFKEDGTILWQTYTGGSSAEEGFERLTVAPSGDLVLAGYSKSGLGGIAVNHGGVDGWLARADQQGKIIFNKLIGGSGDDSLKAVTVSRSGMITAGGSTRSKDGDMSDNVYGHTIWVTSLSADNFQNRQGYFGHPFNDPSSVEDLVTAADGTIYCAANTNSRNPLVKKPLGKTDGWLFSLGEKNVFKGTVYLDDNANGIKDPTEDFVTNGKFEIIKPSNPAANEYVVSDQGNFETWLDTGSYTARFIPQQPYFNTSPQITSLKFASYNLSDSVSIALVPTVRKNDLTVNIIPLSTPRPGFGVSYLLRYKNQGTLTIRNTVLQFIKDPHLQILSTFPSGVLQHADTISWQTGTLKPLDSGSVILTGLLKAPPVTAIGDTLTSKAIILPESGDETIEDNTASLTEIARGSYDPNDKTEFHGGQLPFTALNNDRLLYLVRFQNTGTDTAFNIFIRDTLNPFIDPASLRMVGASHRYVLKVQNHNELEWKFTNIKLPDSNVNERASHGYVLFSVKPVSSLAIGDVIANRASIYFDFNLPVITNSTNTRIVDLALPKPVLSGLQTSYCGTAGTQTVRITNIASAGQAKVTALLNSKSIAIDTEGKFNLQPSLLTAGLQTLVVSFTSNGFSASVSAQFSIVSPVTPTVDMVASRTVIIDNIFPVILSANPQSGAGSAPLFVFSTDRNFTTILQNDALGNSTVVSASTLKTGDNWFYVRMKTSESCYTGLNGIDSIKIVRLAVTSLVDLDYPETSITASPNPFNSTISLRGLQAGASYSLQIVDAMGKIVAVAKVSRQTSFTFKNLILTRGQYFVRLYTGKNNRLIGSIPVLRL